MARPSLRTAALAAGALFALLLLLGVLERVVWSGDVLPGVRVDGVDVEGASERSAYADLSALAAELESTAIEARAGETELSASPSLFGLDIDELATLRDSRRAGRSRNPLEQALGTVLRRIRDDEIDLTVRFDEVGVAGVLDGWQQQVADGVVEGDLVFDGTEVVPVYPEAGTGIVRDDAQDLLVAALRAASRDRLELPVGTVQPRVDRAAVDTAAARARAVLTGEYEVLVAGAALVVRPPAIAASLDAHVAGDELELRIDPERLRFALGEELTAVEQAPVDATFEVSSAGTVSVVPSRSGRQVDLALVGDAILDGQRRITAELLETEPGRDTAWAEALGIRELVSTFTTRHPSGQSRVTNIHRAADIVNNTIVEPGSVFSLNDTLGPRTAERGFVQAPVFYGEFTEDYGGGVSQFATTIFNAVFFGGYEDVEHKPHSIYFSRYPMGREATVNYPSVDLKFRNDSPAGILIRTGYSADSITVSFYGDKEGKVVRAEGPNVLAERPPEVEPIEWPLLPLGEEQELEDGYTGYDVEVFRVIERPGREPVRERFFWRYRMLPRKVLVGTAVPTTTTTTTTSPPTTVAPPTTPTTAPAPP